MEIEKEKTDKGRELEWEKVHRRLSAPKVVEGRGGDVERFMVQSLKLIPDFDECKVSEWFSWFDTTVREFNWREENWVLCVANKLKGKAVEAYAKISSRDMEDCEEFKAGILLPYEFRPEAYRLQFLGERKQASEYYKDFAHYLEQAFKRWIASEQEVSSSDLEELMVMEQLINAGDKELVSLLRKKRFITLKEAAT